MASPFGGGGGEPPTLSFVISRTSPKVASSSPKVCRSHSSCEGIKTPPRRSSSLIPRFRRPQSTNDDIEDHSPPPPQREEAFDMIRIISSSSSYGGTSPSPSLSPPPHPATPDAALSRLRAILDRYLECPSLLDPCLEGMVTRLSSPARIIVRDLFLRLSSSYNDDGDVSGENPVDCDDDDIPEKLDALMHQLSAIYAISKVADVEPVLAALRWFGRLDGGRGRRAGTKNNDAGGGEDP
ncbi:hypothetical protein ACHAW5_005067 [Stephanodiscus triporus]|uniref:Uncharacterized protein n=1 Tax=Stephanodiscus triporus TaxID=2934178 RepID=A0ABD3NWU9_9STRA